MAYLLWRYPEVSLTFVQREIAGLRRRGAEVHTMAIRPAHSHELLSALERESHSTTWTVLPAPVGRTLVVHGRTALRWPAAYAAVLRRALTSAVRGRPRSLVYFAEAVLVAAHLRPLGVRHLHVHLANVAAEVAGLVADLETRRDPASPFTWSLTVHGPDELLRPHEHRLPERVSRADLVVTISEYARGQLMAMTEQDTWGKIHVVHCGLDVDAWAAPERHDLDDPPRVLTVGRLAEQKSHEVLVAAMGLLRRAGTPMRLTIVGEGPSRGRIERAVLEHGVADLVTLAGAVGQQKTREYFENHDLFCLASVAEGLPVVLMEAMASGLPVVTTRITGVPELVEDGVSGLLVPPGRPELLADALARLAVDSDLRRALRTRGREAVRAGFAIDDTASQLESLLRSPGLSTTGS